MRNELPEMQVLEAFVRSVELGSFSAVAAELGVGQPTVSKWIAGLEGQLGMLLLRRTTRSQSLTEAGRIYYDYARRVLELASAAENHLRSLQGSPSGALKVSIPMAFGRLHVLPRLPRFLLEHPRIDLDLEMSDRRVDIVREGFDLAIRIGNLGDSTLLSARLGTTRRVVVATPEYFEARGRPVDPRDLESHECLLYTGVADPSSWRFYRDGETFVVPVKGRFSANNGEAVRAAVLAGVGVAMLPTWLVGDDVERGALEEVLRSHATRAMDMRAVYPAEKPIPPKTLAFVEFLRETLEDLRCHEGTGS